MFWLVCLAVLLAGFWSWKQQKTNLNEPPALSGGLPLIGHLHRLRGDSRKLLIFLREVSDECLKAGGVLSFRLGTRKFYVVADPTDFLTLSNACLRKDKIYDFGKAWIGEGLITAIPAIWKVHRKLLNPVFNQQALERFVSLFNSQSRKFVSDLKCKVGKGLFDHSSDIREIVFETMFFTVFGMDDVDEHFVRNDYLHVFSDTFKIVTKRLVNFFLYYDFIFNMTQLKKKQDESVEMFQHFSNAIIQRRKNYIKHKKSKICDNGLTTDAKFKSFLDIYLELFNDKGLLNDQEIREEIDTLMGAGQDSVHTGLVYIILFIGSHPLVQDKMYNELLEVIGSKDSDVKKHHLPQLVYMEAVIKESLRINTVAPLVARTIEKDIKLSRYTLSGGTTCVLNIHGLHRHESWGPEAEKFIPERWLDPTLASKSAGAFAAFSVGRRACIGKSYALMLMKIILADLVRNYRIKGDHTKMVFKLDLILKPHTGHFIELENR